MLMGAFFAVWGSVWSGSWVVGLLMAMLFGGLLALVHAIFCIHLQADQIVSGFAVNFLALGLTGFLYSSMYPAGSSSRSRASRTSSSTSSTTSRSSATSSTGSSARSTCLSGSCSPSCCSRSSCSSRRRLACGSAPSASIRRPPTRWGSRSTRSATPRSSSSGMLAALGGAFLSFGFVGTFTENMTAGRGYIALAAVIFGKWLPGWAFAATLLFGFWRSRSPGPAPARSGPLGEPRLHPSVRAHPRRARRS